MINTDYSESIRRLAEAPAVYESVGAGEQLIETDRFVLFLGRSDHPRFNTVQYLRVAPEAINATVAEVRALALDHGRHALTWEIASSAVPLDLTDRLREHGMLPSDPPLAVVMALRAPPPPPPPDITVSRVTTVADFRTFVTLTHEVFGLLDQLPTELERIDRAGAADLVDQRFLRYLAWLDGAPVAAATASFTPAGVMLHSGSTRAAARGRGAYRALVAARWADAVHAGTPLVITRAGPMSRPILRRVGFVELAEIHFLEDHDRA